MMTWSDNMSIGVPEVDEQHKQLLLLVNDTEAAVAAGASREDAAKALQRLCDYVVEHFATEEALMDPDGYPEYDKHMSEHMECTNLALDFLQGLNEDKDVSLPEFLVFAQNWIQDHILGTDQTLGRFVAGKK
jgi:hemerythrin